MASPLIPPFPESLGQRLRFLRHSLFLSMDRMAGDLGIRASALAQAEAGCTSLKPERLCRLCTLYGASAHWLLTGHGPVMSPFLIDKEIKAARSVWGRDLVPIPVLKEGVLLGARMQKRRARGQTGTAWVYKTLLTRPGHTYARRSPVHASVLVPEDSYIIVVNDPADLKPWEHLDGRCVLVHLDGKQVVRLFRAAKREWVLRCPVLNGSEDRVGIPREVDPPVLGRVIFWHKPPAFSHKRVSS